MIPWSTIIQDEVTRAVVQEEILTRAIHDPLFPKLLFRADCPYELWPANIGDSQVFTGSGLMKKRGRRRQPLKDPTPDTYGFEQWSATIGRYDGTTDVHHPSTVRAIVNTALQRAAILGTQAGQTLDSQVRNRMFAGAMSGNSWATAAGAATDQLQVASLYGFHEARQTTAVKYTAISATNPLAITIDGVARNVIAVSQDFSEPEGMYGPGTLTLDVAHTWPNRAHVLATDGSQIFRSGGGTTMHALTAADKLTLSLIRQAVAEMRDNNVPAHDDGYYHVHLDATSEAQLYDDPEWRNIHTAAYDSMAYKELVIGVKLGCVFFRNTECPRAGTVQLSATGGFDIDDAFPGGPAMLTNDGGIAVHRVLITGKEGIYEKFSDPDLLVSEAGVTGKTGWFDISLNNIAVVTDRVKFIWRAPLNLTQDISSMTWLFDGDWAIRTDSLTGSSARYKRFRTIEHAG